MRLNASCTPRRCPRPSRLRRCCRRYRPASGPASARGPLWLFDLDNTLYDASRAVFPAINAAMTQYIVDALRVGRAEADRLRTDYTRRYGAALLGLARHHPVDVHEFLQVVHPFDGLPSMLRAERGLARTLAALPGRKIVLTNAPQAWARAVLAQLGIARQFEAVVAIEQMRAHGTRGAWRAKPEPGVLRRVLQRAGVRAARRAQVSPASAILVEDTRGHLKRYRQMGIRTVWMTGHLPASAAPAAPVVPARPGMAAKPSMAVKPGIAARPGMAGMAVIPARPNMAVMPVGSGRPHYVDARIRSLKSLRRMRVLTGQWPRR